MMFFLLSVMIWGRSMAQSRITGIVIDEQGESVIGATVQVKGNEALGAITDIDGKFTLSVPEKSRLIISYVGMETQEVVATENMRIVMKSNSEVLEEVVVTGYQKIDRKLFTGAADVVKADKALIDGVSDVSRMLQGKSAGVQITNVSGTFGASPKIRVRGSSSIYGNQKPLWVIDGVVLEDVIEISADDLSSGNAETLISSAVAGLNADDIASFQILKDASATALYGARAMNGVVVITTKSGRSGPTRINYTGEFTVKMRPTYNRYNIMNSADQMSVYREMYDKGWLNYASVSRHSSGGEFLKMYNLINTWDPKTQRFGMANTPEEINKYLDAISLYNTDWFKELFRSTLQQNHSVSISAGSNKTQFYSSFSFFNDPGWTMADNVNRLTANTNVTHDFNNKLTVRLLTNASLRKQKVPGTLNRKLDVVNGEFSRDFDINPFSYALNTSRTMRAKDENGDPVFYQMNYAPFGILNEMRHNFMNIDMLDSKFQGELSYKLLPGWDVNFLGAVRYVKSTQESRIHENSNLAMAYRAAGDATIRDNNRFLFKDPDDLISYPIVVLPYGGFYNTQDDRLLNYYERFTTNFNRTIGEKHIINLMAGQELKYADRINRWNNGYAYQYSKGGIPNVDYKIMKQILLGGFNYYGMGENYDRFLAFFGTSSYSYQGIYTLNATARYDGSNKLGRSRKARWLPTWNVSGSWNIHEKFMPKNKRLSALSLRGTYGLTASMGPASNALPIFYSGKTFRPTQADVETNAYISSLENSELTWEKQHELNAGLDMGLFSNRISLIMDVYKRNGFDLIGIVRTSGIDGEASKWANYANMKSKGFEFTLNTRNVQTKNFNWTTNVTFAYNENEITQLESQPRVIDLVTANGGALQGYPVRGLFSIPFKGLNENGLPLVLNEKGEVSSQGVYFQYRQDVSWLKYEGPIDPKITGGIDNSIQYKRWKLGFFFTYQFGNVIRLNSDFSHSYSDMNAMPKEMKNRWVLSGDENKTDIPVIPSRRLVYNSANIGRAYNSYNFSDVRTAKGDFIRLKEITISYTLDKKLSQKLGMSNLELRGVASNIWLIYADKKLNGQDPEFTRSGGVAMPMPTQITCSLRAGF